jgi:hypothetical protein
VYYNAGVGEVEEYLWTMWREQHGAEGCAAPQSYALYVAPEGDCPGKVRYVVEDAVLKTLDCPIKPGEVTMITVTWGGRRVKRLKAGAIIGCSADGVNQILMTPDVLAASPTWFDADPNSDLIGALANVAVCGREAYATTWKGTNAEDAGLYYCPDITAAMTGDISWSLLVSEVDAFAEAGYLYGAASFGALAMIGRAVCAVAHYNDIVYRDVESLAYIGSSGVVSPVGLGLYSGKYFYCKGIQDGTLFDMWANGDVFYIGGKANVSTVIRGDADGFAAQVEDTELSDFHFRAVGGGYIIAWDGKLCGPDWTLDVLTTGVDQCGVHVDDARRHYVFVKNGDLYVDGVMMADGAEVFGGTMDGGMATYLPRSSDDLVWVVRKRTLSAAYWVVAYSRDGGVSWENKTGNIYDVLGGNWVGHMWNNAIIRTFDV